ncbi:M23 family metallopeptidase [Amylibacter sp.]|nr:M23 family metallopeptidase [Amylibacter sp.]
MFHKLNILVLLVFLFTPMSALEADTIDLNEEIEGVWNVGNVSPDSSDVIASVNGLVTHGDRLRIRFVKGDCDNGNLFTTVYTYHDNPKLVDLKDQLVGGIFMGEDVVLKILFTVPLFNKQLAYLDMGWVQKDALKNILLAQKEIDLNLLDTEDFKASEYFDILQNSWPTAGLSDAIDKASMKCKSMAFSKLSQRTNNFPIINMINPVEGTMIKDFSKTPSENYGVDIKVAKGTKVKAAAKGTIALISKSRVNETFVVLLRHEENIYTVYSNLFDVSIKKNSVVKSGDTIGTIGSGNPPFLHFEVRNGTKPIDPTQFLTLKAVSNNSTDEPLLKENETQIDLIKTFTTGNQYSIQRIFGNYQRGCTAQQDTDKDEKLKLEADNLTQIKLLQGDTEMIVLTASFYCPGVGGIWSGSGGSPVYYIIDEFVYKTFGGQPYPFNITEDQTVLIQWNGGAECKTTDGQPYPNSDPCFSAIYWNNELSTFSIME